MNPRTPLHNEFEDHSGGGGASGGSSGFPQPSPDDIDFESRGSGDEQVDYGQRYSQPVPEEGQGGTPSAAPPAQGQQQAAGAAPAVDPNLLMQYLLTQSQQQAQQPAQPAQPQLDPAKVDEMLKAVKLDERFIETLLDPDVEPSKKLAAMQEFADKMSVHSSTLAGLAARMAADEVHKQYGGLLEAQQEQKMDTFATSITQHFPGLSDQKPLVRMVLDQMKRDNFQTPVGGPQGAQLAAAEVARRITQVMPHLDIYKPAQGAQSQQRQSQQQRQNFGGMPNLSAPGGGGGGRPSSSQGRTQPNWLGALS